MSIAEHVPADPIPDLPSVSAGTAAAHIALVHECNCIVTQAHFAARRRDLAEKLNAAIIVRDEALIVAIRFQQAALQAENALLTLSDEECHALPDRLQKLKDSLFEYSQKCEFAVLSQVAEQQQKVRDVLASLTRTQESCAPEAAVVSDQTGNLNCFCYRCVLPSVVR
jgi:precorrin-2 methylase